jgi:hypothetical protein
LDEGCAIASLTPGPQLIANVCRAWGRGGGGASNVQGIATC